MSVSASGRAIIFSKWCQKNKKVNSVKIKGYQYIVPNYIV